ncbi:MAG: response regulator [Lachnospiraceae bacterium]|nr:response regulator [Lachnospiraceae bacterium]
MKKIVLIGTLNEIVRSLNECLMEEFRVQLCAPQPEHIQGMVKIVKPDMIVFCGIGTGDSDTAILSRLQEMYSEIPVLIITTSEEWRKYSGFLDGRQFEKLFRPMTKNDLLNKCYQMLHIKKLECRHGLSARRKRLLLVDDSPLTLRNMKSILEEKYDVFLATSGEQALKVIPQNKPDLILLDYEMPGMNGKATFEAILEDESARDIPVVFLTSIADKRQIYAVLKSYPAGYILKPPDKEKLLSVIEDVLMGRKEF